MVSAGPAAAAAAAVSFAALGQHNLSANWSGLPIDADEPPYDPCAPHGQDEMLYLRFYIIAVFGSVVGFVGIINNTFLFYLFMCQLNCLSNHLCYMAFLCLIDILIEVSFIAIFPVDIMSEYYRDVDLYYTWLSYIRPVSTLAHISLTSATYLIVAASIERYMTSQNSNSMFQLKHRLGGLLAVVVVAVIIKGTFYFEIELEYSTDNCTGFEAVWLRPTQLAMTEWYRLYWMFWFRQLLHILFPFFLLLFLNWLIIMNARRQLVSRSMLIQSTMVHEKTHVNNHKKELRAATRMLIAVASMYLVGNTLNVFVTIWEVFDKSSLLSVANGRFYMFCVDFTSLFSLFCGAIRLIVYYLVNKQVRQAVKRTFTYYKQKCSPPSSLRSFFGSRQRSAAVRQQQQQQLPSGTTGRPATIATTSRTLSKRSVSAGSLLQNGSAVRLSNGHIHRSSVHPPIRPQHRLPVNVISFDIDRDDPHRSDANCPLDNRHVRRRTFSWEEVDDVESEATSEYVETPTSATVFPPPAYSSPYDTVPSPRLERHNQQHQQQSTLPVDYVLYSPADRSSSSPRMQFTPCRGDLMEMVSRTRGDQTYLVIHPVVRGCQLPPDSNQSAIVRVTQL